MTAKASHFLYKILNYIQKRKFRERKDIRQTERENLGKERKRVKESDAINKALPEALSFENYEA